jgi:hypothetical protein
MVAKVALGVWKVCSKNSSFFPEPPLSMLNEVFKAWGCTWLWGDLQWRRMVDWIRGAIEQGTCIIVADGSYMPDVQTDVCSTAFFFECTAGAGKLVGSFVDFSVSANAYRGELLVLMAAHLVLLGVNTLHPGLAGTVKVYYNCEGALEKVEGLPPLRLPAQYQHSDILKNILINCSNLSFQVEFKLIKTHQDDWTAFHLLSRPAQLNCAVDAGAKRQLLEADAVGQ